MTRVVFTITQLPKRTDLKIVAIILKTVNRLFRCSIEQPARTRPMCIGTEHFLTLNQIYVPATVPKEVNEQFTRGRLWHAKNSSPAPWQ